MSLLVKTRSLQIFQNNLINNKCIILSINSYLAQIQPQEAERPGIHLAEVLPQAALGFITNIKWIFQINLYYTIANLFQYVTVSYILM